MKRLRNGTDLTAGRLGARDVTVEAIGMKQVEAPRTQPTLILVLGIAALCVGVVLGYMATREGDWPATVLTVGAILGIACAAVLFYYAFFRHPAKTMGLVPEASASSSKATYKLLHRRIYLVEEEKPDFSFRIFTDILKGRCSDCESDDSFLCESLECSSCKLPCPCRTCTKYRSRPRGLIVTRQYPKDVRSKHFLQTTPIVWLSTVAGKDHMDPAKLSLLTDMLDNFMEKAPNGVVLVDGLEYLITANDFQRVLKAVDRWGETAMSSTASLIISLDPRAFHAKELALLEKNKEIVSPHDRTTWHRVKIGT